MALERVEEEFASTDGAELLELFHENSKTNRYERHPTFTIYPSDEAIVRVMDRLRRVKPYRDRPKVPLPEALPAATQTLDQLTASRATARDFTGDSIAFAALAKTLVGSYGITRDNEDNVFPRPFRAIPSGGALFPLELYVQALNVDGLDAGLYHFDAEDGSLDVLSLESEQPADITPLFVQAELVEQAAAVIFVSAVLYRTTFKYGARGYRFILLEAGHFAQNALLTALDQGIQSAVVGGYFDRDVDRYLGLDGVDQSVVYTMLLGA